MPRTRVPEVVDRGAARRQSGPQRRRDARGQRVALRAGERAGAAQRMDLRPEQRLVGIDVPHPRDPALVEEERLDRRTAPLREPAQGARRRARRRADPRRARRRTPPARGARRPAHGAEPARVAEPQLVAVREPDPHPLVRRIRLRVVQEGTSSQWRIRKTSPSRSKTSHFPRRGHRIGRPRTASATSSGASGAHHRWSRTSSAVIARPATSGSRLRRIVSTSGSSARPEDTVRRTGPRAGTVVRAGQRGRSCPRRPSARRGAGCCRRRSGGERAARARGCGRRAPSWGPRRGRP